MAAGDLVTADLELEWRNTLFGWPATTIGITDLQGWYGYTLRGNNIERPSRHGTHPGLKRANERVIEVELTALDDDPTALTTIRTATALDEDPIEEPLVLRAGLATPQYVLARLERFHIPTDADWSYGHHRATLQWIATDPRRYSVTEHTESIGLPLGATGGLTLPATFPLAFGSGTGGGQLILTNAGDTSTWPTFTVTGPVTGPLITNTTTGRLLQFAAGFTVEDGQTMTVDTDARSVTINGVSRRDALVIAQWFPLTPGDTTVTFAGTGAYDPAASFAASWRDAWT